MSAATMAAAGGAFVPADELGAVGDRFRGMMGAHALGRDETGARAPGDPEEFRGLWIRGDRAALEQPLVAVVGARAATGYGEHVTMEFAARLTGAGVGVVSDGSYGVGGAAVRAALASRGRPVVVMAGGVDILWPAGHAALFERVLERGGAIVSEYHPGASPKRDRFQRRAWILAALARAVVVPEAGSRSSALNVASSAFQLGGRSVWAVPGSITSAASAGAHELIAQTRARICTSADEIVAWMRAVRALEGVTA